MGLLKDLISGKQHICSDCNKKFGTILIKSENPNKRDAYLCPNCFKERTEGSTFKINDRRI